MLGEELRRDEPGSPTLDAVGPGRLAGNYRRLGRFHHGEVDFGPCPPQRPAHAKKAARGSDIGAVGVRPGQHRHDFPPHLLVAIDHVVIVELVGLIGVDFFGELSCPNPHPRYQVGGDALGGGDHFHHGAKRFDGPKLLRGECVRRDDVQWMSGQGTNHGEGTSGAAPGVFDDSLTWRQTAVLLRPPNHRQRHSVLV